MHEHFPRHLVQVERSSDRNFGLVFATFFLILSLLPLMGGQPIRLWAIPIALIFFSFALIFPAVLAPLNYCWTKVGTLLHCIVSPITLGILFFFVVTPTAWMIRLLGKDFLRLAIDKDIPSYWIERTPPGPTAESLKNQF